MVIQDQKHVRKRSQVKNNKASVTPIWTSVCCSLRLLAHMVELTTHEFQHTACYLLFCHLGE